jgi:hypothetical protein
MPKVPRKAVAAPKAAGNHGEILGLAASSRGIVRRTTRLKHVFGSGHRYVSLELPDVRAAARGEGT